jgi:molybdate transport system substrate-binding protein
MNAPHITIATFSLIISTLTISTTTSAAEVKVAVAANFAQTLKEISTVFEQDTGHKLAITQGSTGKLYAQISQGAPFEVLLSADDETPEKLITEGKAITGTRFTYAIGRLALWSPKPDLVDEGGQVLKTDKFRYVAIANARVAPYGRAAVQVMQKLGALSSIEPRVVQGESITQTFQFVSTGNAQLGFVAMSQIVSEGKIIKGSAWRVPAHWHSPLQQEAILLAAGKNNPTATAFLAYLKTDKAKSVIRSFGYDI